MQKSLVLRFAMLLGWLAAACGDDGNTTGIPDECNPIGGQGCMLPWPSATYLKADATSSTGFRLDVPVEAMPTNVDEVTVEPGPVNRYDGFTMSGPMLVAFPTGVSVTGLPSHKNPDESLAPNSPIVLVDIATGQRAPFFAEIDQNVAEITKRDLIIRPLARLKPGTRYVVAIRKGVKAADGGELTSPPGFAALLAGKDFGHPRFAEIKKRWPMIESGLAAIGVDKSDLVLAWDFVTASDEFMRSDLTTMRNAALPAIGTDFR